jgi:Aldo/keto reductase family
MRGGVAGDRRESTLADGAQLPLLGLSVWQAPNGRECVDAVRWALELGYRHIDTAQAYGNEQNVGQGLRESGLPRDQVFITTKFNPARRDPDAERLSAASSGSGSSASTCTSSTGRRADRPGRGREWSELRSLVTHARSGFPTSTSPNSNGCSQRRASRRSSTRCNSVRTSTERGSSTRVAGTGSSSRLTVLSDTVGTSAAKQPHGSRSASAARRPRCCSAGASSARFR